MCLKKCVHKSGDVLYFLFRVIVGAFFFFHGLSKFVPGFGGPGDITKFAGMFGSFGFVAYLVAIGEILVGLGIVFGFLTRLSALGGAVIMLGAVLLVHIGLMQGNFNLNFVANGAETALLYLGSFFAIFVHGAGKWSLEQATLKKELLW